MAIRDTTAHVDLFFFARVYLGRETDPPDPPSLKIADGLDRLAGGSHPKQIHRNPKRMARDGKAQQGGEA